MEFGPEFLTRYLEQTHQNSSSFSTRIKNGISLTFVRFMIMVFVWPPVCGQHYIYVYINCDFQVVIVYACSKSLVKFSGPQAPKDERGTAIYTCFNFLSKTLDLYVRKFFSLYLVMGGELGNETYIYVLPESSA